MNRTATRLYVCGWCAGAPRSHGAVSHRHCPGDVCACSIRNHRPDRPIREVQSVNNGLTVERCEALDPWPS